MSFKALQFNLIIAMLGAFALFAHASLDFTATEHKQHAAFHPKPLPNPNAIAVLSIFHYDARGLQEADEIIHPKPTIQEAMSRYDR